MKLSEAIRQGAKLRPQSVGRYFETDDQDETVYASCALGAAHEAVSGNTDTLELVDHLADEFPELRSFRAQNPMKQWSDHLWVVITNLNDKQGWSRERIADYLETLGY